MIRVRMSINGKAMISLPRVLITNGIPMEGATFTESFHMDYPGEGQAFSREDMLALLPKADAILACSALDRNMMECAKNAKVVVCYGAGYDAIDMDAATELDIPVINIPDTVTDATAELAMSLMLCLARRVCELDGLMRQGDARNAFGLGKRMGTSLRGATLGIVGMGRIGARVAEFGHFMGMRVLYASRTAKPAQELWGARRCSLEALMKDADFISLHCPYTLETHELISRELLYSMKPTAFFINTARGHVVDEEALLAVLRESRIAGAGLDVFVGEPGIRPEWTRLPNALLTPHVGSNTAQARKEMIATACGRIMDALAGHKPENLLNPQAWKESER